MKKLNLLGLGRKSIQYLPITPNGAADTTGLRERIINYRQEKKYVLAIIAIAGATETGTIDPIEKLADIACEFGIYLSR